MTLLHNPIFLLLFIIVLGELLGKVRLWNLSLGSSAIIFVALAFGHFGFTRLFQFHRLRKPGFFFHGS